MAEPGKNSTGYVELLRRNRDFRFLWSGQIVSLLGDWFNLIASATLITQISDSGLAIGTLFVVRMLAPFAVSPIAGVVADRYDRKRTLIVSDLARAAVVLGFLFIRDPSQLWLLYLLTALQLGISGFFYPARTAMLPEVVSESELGVANTLSSASWSAMLAIGAALGGLAAGTLGVGPAFVIDSISFLVSALLIQQVAENRKKKEIPKGKSAAGAFQQYRDGLRYLYERRPVLIITLHKACVAFFLSSGFQVAQVAIAEDVFPIGESGGITLGLMFAVSGLGTGVGPILARAFTGDQPRSLSKAILIGYLVGGAGLLVVAPLSSLEMLLAGNLLRGLGGGIVWVFSTQLLLQMTPGHVQGRVFGTEFAFFTLAGAIAASLGGWAVDSSLGLTGTIWTLGILVLAPAAMWALRLRTTVAGSPAGDKNENSGA